MSVTKKKRAPRKPLDSPFRKNLQGLMKEKGLTAKKVAELSGVSPTVVQNWLTGSVPHNFLAVASLSNALGVDFQWLLTGVHGAAPTVNALSLAELFDIEPDPSFSGMFMLEAKRLRRKDKA
jgi:transcriptional regulator with XRE-family HTH domain